MGEHRSIVARPKIEGLKITGRKPWSKERMQKSERILTQDYGTSCSDCERYQKLGDICMIEHGKKFQWEYCRDFVPEVVLPDYKELMRSVREDHALERQKEKEKKEKERRKRLKESAEREEERKKRRRAMLRKRRERLKQKLQKAQLSAERKTKKDSKPETSQSGADSKEPVERKTGSSHLEHSENGVVRERDRIPRKRANVSDDKR